MINYCIRNKNVCIETSELLLTSLIHPDNAKHCVRPIASRGISAYIL